MSWKVKAFAWNAKGRRFKTVAEGDRWDDEFMRTVSYWIRNMDPGEKVVITRKKEK